MKRVIEVYQNDEIARHKRDLLKAHKIDAQMFVDPMSDRHPALAQFHGVAIVVEDRFQSEAAKLLDLSGDAMRKVS